MITLRPDSGGLIELELFRGDDNPGEEPTIMLNITAPLPQTQHFALSPETARLVIQGLTEQLKAYARWKALQEARERREALDRAKKAEQ